MCNMKVLVTQLCLTLCNASCVWLFATHGLKPSRLLCPWNSPGKNTRVGCYSLLQEIFLTQGLNLGLLRFRQILYYLRNQGSNQEKSPGKGSHEGRSVCVCVLSRFSPVQLFVTPWTIACQAPLFVGFSR